MIKTPNINWKLTQGVLLALALFGACVGCGAKDDGPTNTKNSQYIDNGKTAADIIGNDRAAAHRPRLPGKGDGG